jgi:hypothetical protein
VYSVLAVDTDDFLLSAAPPRTPENDNLYAWQIAEKENFNEKCIRSGMSTIDALLVHGKSFCC